MHVAPTGICIQLIELVNTVSASPSSTAYLMNNHYFAVFFPRHVVDDTTNHLGELIAYVPLFTIPSDAVTELVTDERRQM